jgi:hypothetical protein
MFGEAQYRRYNNALVRGGVNLLLSANAASRVTGGYDRSNARWKMAERT